MKRKQYKKLGLVVIDEQHDWSDKKLKARKTPVP
jgi:RecG-like helicase